MKKEVLVYIIGFSVVTWLLGVFFIPVMDIDTAQYASISREMLLHKNYLQVYDLGKDYLDKPPMLFWLSSASMYVFGIHDWAYRLPSFLFALLSVYSIYRFAKLFYDQKIALLAAVILASCQAMFLINHDVRTDTMLMGWVTLSLWQLAAWYSNNKWHHLLLAAVAVAGGIMTKGPLALMIPVFSFAPHFILQRNWKQFYRWQYLPFLLLIALLLVPMSIGLYRQFDLHPEKIINGETGVSGLRFFYWTQSFGRITGESKVHEDVNFFFLLQNMLWSFLPWILFFLLAIGTEIIQLFKNKFRLQHNGEIISISGFVITYCALGTSQAQLPHYIFIVFPFAALITARFLFRLLYGNGYTKWVKPLLVLHTVIYTLLWVACVVLLAIPFTAIPWYTPVLAAICGGVNLYLLYSKKLQFPNLLAGSVFTIIGLNVFLNTSFYPALLQYQTGSIAAHYIEEKQLPKEKIYIYGNVVESRNSLFFYSNYFYKKIDDTAMLEKGMYVLTSSQDLTQITATRKCTILLAGKGFPVTLLSLNFLNPQTRDGELEPFFLVQVN